MGGAGCNALSIVSSSNTFKDRAYEEIKDLVCCSMYYKRIFTFGITSCLVDTACKKFAATSASHPSLIKW